MCFLEYILKYFWHRIFVFFSHLKWSNTSKSIPPISPKNKYVPQCEIVHTFFLKAALMWLFREQFWLSSTVWILLDNLHISNF